MDYNFEKPHENDQSFGNNAWRRDKKDFFQNLQFYKNLTKDVSGNPS